MFHKEELRDRLMDMAFEDVHLVKKCLIKGCWKGSRHNNEQYDCSISILGVYFQPVTLFCI